MEPPLWPVPPRFISPPVSEENPGVLVAPAFHEHDVLHVTTALLWNPLLDCVTVNAQILSICAQMVASKLNKWRQSMC